MLSRSQLRLSTVAKRKMSSLDALSRFQLEQDLVQKVINNYTDLTNRGKKFSVLDPKPCQHTRQREGWHCSQSGFLLARYKYGTSSLWPCTLCFQVLLFLPPNGKTSGINVWRTNFTRFTQLLEPPYIVELSVVIILYWSFLPHTLIYCKASSANLQTLEFHSQWSTYWWNVQICRLSGKNISLLLLWKTYFKVWTIAK